MGRARRKAGRGRRPAAAKPPGRERLALGRTPALAVLALLVLLGGLARTLPAWPHVYPAPGVTGAAATEPGEVRLLGIDAYFHLRHAETAARHFPHLQRWDASTAYPFGERSNGVGLFDLALGGVARIVGLGEATRADLLRVAAWTPVVLGAAVLLLLYALARTVLGRPGALLACAILTLYPGHLLGRTLLGFADHHVAEVLLALATLLGLGACLAGQRRPDAPPAWRPALLASLPLAAFQFTWSGAPLYLGIAGLSLAAVACADLARGEPLRPFALACWRYGLGLGVWLSAGLAAPALVMEPAYFHHLLAAAAALAVGLPLALAAAAGARRRGVPGPVCAGALALLGVALGVAGLRYSPELAGVVARLLGTKTALVDEQRAVDLAGFLNLLGPAGLLALAAPPLALWAAWRRPPAGRALLPVVFGALVLALWWRTHDYDYAPPAFVALMAAFALAESARLAGLDRRPRRAAALAAALLLLPLWPLGATRSPWVRSEEVVRLAELNAGWSQAMRWLRESTPEPSLPVHAPVAAWAGGDFAHPEGSYGVFSSWEFGSFVSALGERHAVHSRGFGFQTFAYFLAEDEARGRAILCPACGPGEEVRYVAIDARSLGDYFAGKALHDEYSLERFRGSAGRVSFEGQELELPTLGDAYRRTLAARLYLDDGRGLAHHRLVYESPHRSYLTYVASPRADGGFRTLRKSFPIDTPAQASLYARWRDASPAADTPIGFLYEGDITASVKLFEVVPGARLAGDAPPGALVEASLRLRARASGRELVYRQSGRAGPDGRFELVVPHPSRPEPAVDVEPLGAYTLRVDGEAGTRRLEVAAEQVRLGDRIELEPRSLAATAGEGLR